MKIRNFVIITGVFLLGIFQLSYAAFPIHHSKTAELHFSRNDGADDHSNNKKPHNRANTAVILGAIGLVAMPLGVVCSVLAIVFGAQEVKGPKKKAATLGLILGIAGVALFLVTALLILASLDAIRLFFL